MKAMKKLMALALVLTMVLALATTAFAAGGTISLASGSTASYTVYQILKATAIGSGYIYTANDEWVDFVTGPAASYFDYDSSTKNVTVKKGATISGSDFAALAATYAANNSLTAVGTVTPTVPLTVEENGYYLLAASSGGVSGVWHVVNDGDEEITVKSTTTTGYPSLTKSVEEDSNPGTYVEANDAEIGQTINFQIKVEVSKSGTNYVIHDVMAEQLSFIEVTSVTLKGTTLTAGTDYTVITSTTDGCTFEVNILKSLADSTDGDALIINYTAKLNEKAAHDTAYTNKAWLTHGTTGETPEDTTTTKTYQYEVTKTDATNAPMAGAGFTLTDADNNVINLVKKTEGGVVKYFVCSAATCDHEAGIHQTEVFSGTDGKITIIGLDNEEYTLEETTVPNGYVKADNTEFTPPTHTSTTIQNVLGSTLPETGGMGTTMFYVVGAVLVVAAVALVATKKRYAAK